MRMYDTDLTRWIEETVQAVRHICVKKQAFPVIIGIGFFDPFAPADMQWSFTIEMADNPHNPLPEEERRRRVEAMEYIVQGAAMILEGVAVKAPSREEPLQ